MTHSCDLLSMSTSFPPLETRFDFLARSFVGHESRSLQVELVEGNVRSLRSTYVLPDILLIEFLDVRVCEERCIISSASSTNMERRAHEGRLP